MVIEINLRKAQPSDFFTNRLELLSNKVYFEYSYLTNEMQGPFLSPMIAKDVVGFSAADQKRAKDNQIITQEWIDKLMNSKQSVYVPQYEEVSPLLTHNVKMRLAKPEDLKISNSEKRVNFSYYLVEKGKFVGPFTLMYGTNPEDIKSYLDNEIIYVIDSWRAQQLFINKKAS